MFLRIDFIIERTGRAFWVRCSNFPANWKSANFDRSDCNKNLCAENFTPLAKKEPLILSSIDTQRQQFHCSDTYISFYSRFKQKIRVELFKKQGVTSSNKFNILSTLDTFPFCVSQYTLNSWSQFHYTNLWDRYKIKYLTNRLGEGLYSSSGVKGEGFSPILDSHTIYVVLLVVSRKYMYGL